MVQYRPRWDAKLGREVFDEINKGRCESHPDAVQMPTWDGVEGHGHRIWICAVCWHVTHDPDCRKCAANGGPR